VLTRAGDEASVSCKTYLAALVALAWLGSVLEGADAETASAPLLSAGDVVGEYLADWQDHVADLGRDLDGVSSVFLVGRGTSLAAAATGGLIVKESTRVHAEGMSSAAFRHGPLEMVSGAVFVLVFEGEAPTRDLNRRLAADIGAAGGRCALVAREAERPALRLPRLAPELSPVLEILPIQMLSLALAARDGREAGRFTIGRKVTTSE
jgi:glucosamine--fructose-6-phosphate aminotransferase (isomerizing)